MVALGGVCTKCTGKWYYVILKVMFWKYKSSKYKLISVSNFDNYSYLPTEIGFRVSEKGFGWLDRMSGGQNT